VLISTSRGGCQKLAVVRHTPGPIDDGAVKERRRRRKKKGGGKNKIGLEEPTVEGEKGVSRRVTVSARMNRKKFGPFVAVTSVREKKRKEMTNWGEKKGKHGRLPVRLHG